MISEQLRLSSRAWRDPKITAMGGKLHSSGDRRVGRKKGILQGCGWGMEFLGEGFSSVLGAVLHTWLPQAPCTKWVNENKTRAQHGNKHPGTGEICLRTSPT